MNLERQDKSLCISKSVKMISINLFLKCQVLWLQPIYTIGSKITLHFVSNLYNSEIKFYLHWICFSNWKLHYACNLKKKIQIEYELKLKSNWICLSLNISNKKTEIDLGLFRHISSITITSMIHFNK